MDKLVTAKNVAKRFGDLRAVDGVSFEIEKAASWG